MTTERPNDRVPVLIFGPQVAALGVLRLLAGRGIECYVVDATSDIIVRSRWYRPTERTLAETSDSEELAGFLRSLNMPRAVLIPCSDLWALAVAGLPPETRQRFPASVPPREAVAQFVDKDRFRALVDRLDIPRPRSLLIREPEDLDLATDEDLASGFLKPTESHRHNRRFGTKGFFVNSRDQAVHLVEQASAAGITFILQEWIPGDTSRTVLIEGFVDREGTITTLVARRRIRMDPPRLANTASGVTIPLAEVRECLRPLRALLADVDYRGVFNVEYKFDDRDGLFKIIELNPRLAWFVAQVAGAGVDLPWMSYLDAQELPAPEPAPYHIGRYGLYEILDAAALVRSWRSLRRPDGPILAPWLKGDHLLFRWSDPLPAVAAVWQMLTRRAGRLLGRSRRATGRGR